MTYKKFQVQIFIHLGNKIFTLNYKHCKMMQIKILSKIRTQK